MSKKMKLKLDDFNVNSFVTSLDMGESNKIKGGTAPTIYHLSCLTCVWLCDPTPLCTQDITNCGPCTDDDPTSPDIKI